MFHRKAPEKAILVLNMSILGLGKLKGQYLELEWRERVYVYRSDMYSGASLLRTQYMNKLLLYSRLSILISFNFWSAVRLTLQLFCAENLISF